MAFIKNTKIEYSIVLNRLPEYSLHSLGLESAVPYPLLTSLLSFASSHILTIPYFPLGVYVMAFHVSIHHVP